MASETESKVTVPSGISAQFEVFSFEAGRLEKIWQPPELPSPHILVVSQRQDLDSLRGEYPIFNSLHLATFDSLADEFEKSVEGLLGMTQRLKEKPDIRYSPVTTSQSLGIFSLTQTSNLERDAKEVFEAGLTAFALPITLELITLKKGLKQIVMVSTLVNPYIYGDKDISWILNLPRRRKPEVPVPKLRFRLEREVTVHPYHKRLYIVAVNPPSPNPH